MERNFVHLIETFFCVGLFLHSGASSSEKGSTYGLITLDERCPSAVPRYIGTQPTLIRLNLSGKPGHRCVFHVLTRDTYGLAVFIEQLNVDCQKGKYLQFRATLPGRWKPTRTFSNPLCGKANATSHDFHFMGLKDLHRWQFFNESVNRLQIDYSVGAGGSFLLVVTPTRPNCAGHNYARCGSGYCVPISSLCDGHINCMESPGLEADDERRRECLGNLTTRVSLYPPHNPSSKR